MATHALGPGDGLYYEHIRPAADDGRTFVFFNALTGNTGMWRSNVLPGLEENGHGALLYNMRGQAESPFSDPSAVTPAQIVQDAVSLLQAEQPTRPVLVGLSIGGLFAAQAHLAGVPAEALVLINTLRRPGPRISWITEATFRAVQVGGPGLLRDLFTPLLFNEDWLREHRDEFLGEEPYAPLEAGTGPYLLMQNAGQADWNLPYEQLALPTLVITGLQDRVFYEEGDVAALAARLPNAERLDFPDAGHMIPVERPRRLTHALLDLARRL